jgi:hypothetical protein
MSESGFYKWDTGNSNMLGPSPSVWWALLAYNKDLYGPYPCLGWSWQDEGLNGPGFYYTDGTYKSGVLPIENLAQLSLTTPDQEAFGWKWFDTRAEAYTYNGQTPPRVPMQWMPETSYAVDDFIVAGDSTYACVQEGVSRPFGDGPSGMGDFIPDGSAVWSFSGFSQ